MYIPLKEAAELLGVCDTVFYTSKKYEPYFKPSVDGKRNTACFNYQAYAKHDDLKYELTEKTKLFVEYMHYIEGWDYTKIAKVGNIHVQSIHMHSFGYERALEICLKFRNYYPFHFKRFDAYYGFRESQRLAKITHTVYGWRKK